MKACPLRMLALESSPETVESAGDVPAIIEGDGEFVARKIVGCLEEHCAWWDGEMCTMLAISEALTGIKDALSILDLTIYQKE